MTNVLEPRNELLRKFVDSIYIFRRSTETLEFTAYPSQNLPVALLRNASVTVEGTMIDINGSDSPDHFCIVCNQFSDSAHLRYREIVDEIAINFKPLGFPSFTGAKPRDNKVFRFGEWDEWLPGLFYTVWKAENEERKLFCIEQFLLDRYRPLDHESALLKALELLADGTAGYKMEEVARLVGMHPKHLYRRFTAYVGCTPAHYRKLVKFRNSIASRLKEGNEARLVDICYAQDYTDQAYFIKQFRELTGEKPNRFFKEVTSFGDKVVFKIA